MKGRETKGPPSADLLVCFPSRAHLSLMPKTICSPSRPNEPNKRHQHHQSHLKRSTTRGGGGAHASPLLWAKNKPMGSEISEPTSPKVTCAGQIKVRSKPNSSCKNWQSVMEEIERLHNDRKQKKKSNWAEALGFKKDVMQFLTCLRNIKFDFQCFGSFPVTGLSSDDEDDNDDEDDDPRETNLMGLDDEVKDEASTPVFSKWFMVLQEEQSNMLKITEHETEERLSKEEPVIGSCVPPPNALLLMRCRSAPAKSWLEERDEERENEEKKKRETEEEKKIESAMEEERKSRSLAMLMRYDTDFYKLSCDIAKETWVVGGVEDQFTRSRSWKR